MISTGLGRHCARVSYLKQRQWQQQSNLNLSNVSKQHNQSFMLSLQAYGATISMQLHVAVWCVVDKRNDIQTVLVKYYRRQSSLKKFAGRSAKQGNIVSSAQNYCLLSHQIKFISLFSKLTSMAGLCYDRYMKMSRFQRSENVVFQEMNEVSDSWANFTTHSHSKCIRQFLCNKFPR